MEEVLNTALGTFIGVGVILLVLWALHEREQRQKREKAQAAREFKNFLDEMSKELEESRRAQEMLEAVTKDIVGKRKPRASDVPKIEKAFHENMEDHWVKLTFDKKTGKFDAEVQKTPFEAAKPKRKPATKKTPTQKTVTKKPVTKKAGK